MKTKTNYDLHARISPRFRLATAVHVTASNYDWLITLFRSVVIGWFWFYDTQLKTTLKWRQCYFSHSLFDVIFIIVIPSALMVSNSKHLWIQYRKRLLTAVTTKICKVWFSKTNWEAVSDFVTRRSFNREKVCLESGTLAVCTAYPKKNPGLCRNFFRLYYIFISAQVVFITAMITYIFIH